MYFLNNIITNMKLFFKFNEFKNENIEKKLGILIISFFPIFILSGSAIINIFTILLIIIFAKELSNNLNIKNFKIFNDIFFFLIVVFFVSLIINIFFSQNGTSNFYRQLGVVRFLILAYAIKYFLSYKNFKFFKYVTRFWTIIFFIVSFDILFEFIFGFNTLGYVSEINGRITSFSADEYKIGNFYYGFFLIAIVYFFKNLKFNKINFLLLVFLIILSFLIGERSNFIKIFISIILFFLISNILSRDKKFLSIIIIVFSTFIISKNTPYLKNKYLDQIFKPFISKGIIKTIAESHYGVHYYTAYKIYKNYPIFGIGLKQYRFESLKEEYKKNKYNTYNMDRWATHPHQIHFEFLCETGSFGYINFLIFFIMTIYFSIKKFYYNQNLYLLASTIFIITTFIPLIPSGSFFTTYSASIFWFNFGILLSTYSINNK